MNKLLPVLVCMFLLGQPAEAGVLKKVLKVVTLPLCAIEVFGHFAANAVGTTAHRITGDE